MSPDYTPGAPRLARRLDRSESESDRLRADPVPALHRRRADAQLDHLQAQHVEGEGKYAVDQVALLVEQVHWQFNRPAGPASAILSRTDPDQRFILLQHRRAPFHFISRAPSAAPG